MWWERLEWDTSTTPWRAPLGPSVRSVDTNRGSGAAAAAEVRLCWEVDQSSPRGYNPALSATGRALLLTPA